MTRYLWISIICICVSCDSQHQSRESSIVVDVWYGDHQQFGTVGLPQYWINVLGNVTAESGVRKLRYRINDNTPLTLTLGSDLHRLAADGDFNIEIPIDHCQQGSNKLEIEVTDFAGFTISKQIELQVNKRAQWPLPYSIRWDSVSDIKEVVQVVDGRWEITKDGLHNLDTYYDRVVALGDSSWKNYQVSTTVIFHDFTPPEKGPPTYNVSHAAIASRWPGHDIDDLQPHRKWFPLGATSEFRLTAGLDSCRWRIFDGPKSEADNFHVEQTPEAFRSIELNKKYGMKHRVQSLGSNRTQYSVKLWPYDRIEPEHWDFQGIEENENLASGSVLLIAHNTSLTFGDIMVVPININE